MTTHPVFERLARANPVAPDSGDPGERAEAERVLARVLAAPVRPAHPGRAGRAVRVLVPALSTAVVVGVVALFVGAGSSHSGRGGAGPVRGGGPVLMLQALASPRSGVTPRALNREVTLLRERAALLGIRAFIRPAGTDRISVGLGAGEGRDLRRVIGALTSVGRLAFFDWEADVLTPAGQTVASALGGGDGRAVLLSQGAATVAPGEPGAGGVSLYAAVAQAARRPAAPASAQLTRLGTEYYLFGAAGSPACDRAAVAARMPAVRTGHCLLAGPVDEPAGAPQAQVQRDIAVELPAGVQPAAGALLGVPQGTVVLEAQATPPGRDVGIADPAARFFVARDAIALSGRDITSPSAGSDAGGSPDVQFSFRGAGAARFQALTARIAHRGLQLSIGATENQHLGVSLDGRLVTVAQIDFHQYPDGIAGDGGTDLAGGFSRAGAQSVATELAHGALPLMLRLVG